MQESRFEKFMSMSKNASKTVQRIKTQRMKEYGLTSAHTNCIHRLFSAGESGMTQARLVEMEMMDASQISRVLRDLIQRGYVYVEGDDGTYRRHYILTEKGFEIGEKVREIVLEINQFVSCDIPPEDIDCFYRTFEKVCKGLNLAAERFCTDEHGA